MKKVSISIFLFLSVYTQLFAQQVIQLYEGKPKGSENWDWKEQTNFNPVFHAEEVANITQPTLLAFMPPKELATGTAIIIAPPGGFHILSVKNHGEEVAKWLNSKGIAVFVLKYRLARSLTDNPFQEMVSKDPKKLDEESKMIEPLALADGLNAVKYLRDHAKELNIDTNKIGFMGFSSGGALTMSVACNANDTNRPSFLASIYGDGNACNDSNIPKNKMPLFLAVASDDPFGAVPLSMDIYKKWQEAQQTAELHIYEKGGHGFSMFKQNLPTDTWYERFGDWLKLQGYITPPTAVTSPFQRIPSPNDSLQSVKILPDGKVKFSIYAPKASEVTLMGDFGKTFAPLNLSKDAFGVWSALSIDVINPNVYTYDFTIDGIKTLDPKNTQFKESNTGFSNLFEVKGAENDFQSLKNVPHGKIEKVFYSSTALDGITRRLHIYTPPNYETLKKKGKLPQERLPVLYLFHGGGDNDASWTTVGRANLIFDNLYAEGKLKPMIVVMSAGHTPVKGNAMGAGPEADPFSKDFLQDIIPFVEKNYPVSTKREHRAIAGLSMGGIQTLNIALWNPTMFGYVFPMSTGYFPNLIKELEEKHTSVLTNKSINEFKKFKIYMGGEADIAYKNNINTMALFDKSGIKYSYQNIEGGHTFLTWRKNLQDFAPLLFK